MFLELWYDGEYHAEIGRRIGNVGEYGVRFYKFAFFCSGDLVEKTKIKCELFYRKPSWEPIGRDRWSSTKDKEYSYSKAMSTAAYARLVKVTFLYTNCDSLSEGTRFVDIG